MVLSAYALCPILKPYTLCPMPYALWSIPYTLIPYAICPMLYALVYPIPYALCAMRYALYPILYALQLPRRRAKMNGGEVLSATRLVECSWGGWQLQKSERERERE